MDPRHAELLGAVDALFAAEPLRTRMATISTPMKAADGTTKAADLIERVAITQGPPVTRG